MGDFLIVPLPAETAAEVRSTLRAPGYGHPAHAELAGGYGPCRSCLQTFSAGEERRIHGVEADAALAELFARPEVEYVHVRNTEAGCFVCHAARAA